MDSPLELYHSCISETILAPSFLLFGKNFNIMSCLLVLPYTMEIANRKKKKKKRVFALFFYMVTDTLGGNVLSPSNSVGDSPNSLGLLGSESNSIHCPRCT